MRKPLYICMVLGIFIYAFKTDFSVLFKIPEQWPKPIYSFDKNPLTQEKIALGRFLFYDPILSKNNTVSCASCHSSYNAFTHVDHALSHGIDDRIGTRNSPALMNLAWHKLYMWDGAINHLDMQALAPMSHPDEMGEKIDHVVYKLQHTTHYPALFYKAFNDSIITGEHLLKSISQFMLTLVSAEAKYDSVMRGQSEFTQQEKNGYIIFKQQCASCHQEPLFSTFEFENNGLTMDTVLNDIGRMKITKNPNDSLKFKVPTLRNIEYTFPYMHDGRFNKLSAVINHYERGIVKSNTLSKKLQTNMVLTSNEKVDLIAFLLTLSDKKFLFNNQYNFPKELLPYLNK
jgi:cytochrome c peroxidase